MYEWIKNRQGCVPTHSDLVHAVLISSGCMGIHPADKGKVNVFVSRRNNRGTATMLRCSFHEGIRVFTKACQESRTILFTICLKGVVQRNDFFSWKGVRVGKRKQERKAILSFPIPAVAVSMVTRSPLFTTCPVSTCRKCPLRQETAIASAWLSGHFLQVEMGPRNRCNGGVGFFYFFLTHSDPFLIKKWFLQTIPLNS